MNISETLVREMVDGCDSLSYEYTHCQKGGLFGGANMLLSLKQCDSARAKTRVHSI